jgi:hypothetical protein
MFRIVVSFAVAALLLFILSGCAGLVDATMGVGSALDKGKQKVSGAAERAVMDATGISEMQDAVLASVVYSYAFFAGGYMTGYEDFSEGEGVSWKLTVSDEEGEESVTIERALLRKTGDGREWWFLSYSTEEDEMISEALLNEDYEIEIFRYRDPETDQIREWRPETEEEEAEAEAAAEGDAEEAEEMPDFYEGSWQDHVVGTERITVPAGTYTAEHVRIVSEYEYEADTGAEASEGDAAEQEAETVSGELTYEWWISEEAPGNLVKYHWRDSTEEDEFRGELVSHRRDYRTRLDSF